MEKLYDLVNYGYNILIGMGVDGYYVNMTKQFEIDFIDEYETKEYKTIEEALAEALEYSFI